MRLAGDASRVCIITTSYPCAPGDPAGHFVAAEARELERGGAHVTVVKPSPGGAFGWPGVAARLRERPWRAVEAVAWSARAASEVRAARPSRILAHWTLPSVWPIACARGLREIPLEAVSHGADVRLLCALPAAARTRFVTLVAARASQWRFVSHALLAELSATLDGEARAAVERVAVIQASPLGDMTVDADVVRRRRAALGGRRLYVCAGRLVPSKRVDKVIDYVASTGRQHAPVLVVLGDGPLRAHLEELASRWRIDARFLGTTPRGEALSWISAADEVVHASQAEGLSTVLREAEQLGVNVTRL